MTTQTSMVAQQTRLRQWAEQIQDCRNRPDGLSVEAWCAQNNSKRLDFRYDKKFPDYFSVVGAP